MDPTLAQEAITALARVVYDIEDPSDQHDTLVIIGMLSEFLPER